MFLGTRSLQSCWFASSLSSVLFARSPRTSRPTWGSRVQQSWRCRRLVKPTLLVSSRTPISAWVSVYFYKSSLMLAMFGLVYRHSFMSGHPCQEGDDHAQGHSAGQKDQRRKGLSRIGACCEFPLINAQEYHSVLSFWSLHLVCALDTWNIDRD